MGHTATIRTIGNWLLCGVAVGISLGACSDLSEAEADSELDAGSESRTTVPSPKEGQAPSLTGSGVGCVRVGMYVSDLEAECSIIGDTTFHLEGQEQVGLLVDVSGATVLAELHDDRVWRIRVWSPDLETREGFGVGTPARELAALPQARIARGEGNIVLLVPELCGLSFDVTGPGLPAQTRDLAIEDLAGMPDSVTVRMVLVVGSCQGAVDP